MNTILPVVAVAIAGSAHSAALAQPDLNDGGVVTVRALTATPVIGLTLEGLPILGETVVLGDGENASRGAAPSRAFYDTLIMDVCPACGPVRQSTPSGLNSQVIADDISFDAAFAGAVYDGGLMTIGLLGDPGGATDTNLDMLVEFYESASLNPAFDGTDGFDNDGDGVPDAPFDRSTFVSGVFLSFGMQSIVPGQELLLSTEALASSGLMLMLPSSDDNGDGTVDGTYQISLLSGLEDIDGDGIAETLIPVPGVEVFLGGAMPDYPDACFGAGGRPDLGDSTLGVWAQGEGAIGGLSSWSESGTSEELDDVYDPAVDLKIIVPSDPSCNERVHWAVTLLAVGVDANRYCADVNGDGEADPGDFTAWVAAYNQGDLRADANQNGTTEPGDFTAWVSAFNLGLFGPQCSP